MNKLLKFALTVLFLGSVCIFWLNFGPGLEEFLGFKGKTLWDFLELLIVPFALAIIAFGLSRTEKAEERRLALDDQRERALQEYMDRMAELILNKHTDDPSMNLPDTPNAPLIPNKSTHLSKIKAVAVARTHAVLRRLDPNRKGAIVTFLKDAELIIGPTPFISLQGAPLEGVILRWANLTEVNLRGANLVNAQLTSANFKGAYLEEALLLQANLEWANLTGAHLESAFVSRSNLRGANLTGAHLERAHFEGTNLKGADLRGAFLDGTLLATEYYFGGPIEKANLKGAHLPENYSSKLDNKGMLITLEATSEEDTTES